MLTFFLWNASVPTSNIRRDTTSAVNRVETTPIARLYANPWIEPEPLRRESFKAYMWSGNPRQLLALIRTIYQRKTELAVCGKKLRSSDAAFLKDAERLLHEEFAYVLEIPVPEVPAYIESQI